MEKENKKLGRPKLADKETKRNAIISILVSMLLVIVLVLGGTLTLSNSFNSNNLKGATITNSETTDGFVKIVNDFDDLVNLEYDNFFDHVIEVEDGYITLLDFTSEKSSIKIDGKDYTASDNFFLFKYDKNGNLLWKKAYEKFFDTLNCNIVSLENDKFAIVGTRKNSMLFYKMDLSGNVLLKNESISFENLNQGYTFHNCESVVNSSLEIINVIPVSSDITHGFLVVKIKKDGTVLNNKYIESNSYLQTEIIVDNVGNIVFGIDSDVKSQLIKLDGNTFDKISSIDIEEDYSINSVSSDNDGHYILSLLSNKNLNSKLVKLDNNFLKIKKVNLDKESYASVITSPSGYIYVSSSTLEQDKYYLTVSKYDNDLVNIWKKVDFKESNKTSRNIIISNFEKMVIVGNDQTSSGIPFAFLSIYQKKYNVTAETSIYGDVKIINQTPFFGEQISLTITPKVNYLVSDVRIINSLTNEDVTEKVNYNSSNNTFIMPGYDVKIMVSYTLSPVNTTTSSKTDNNTTTTTKNNTTTTVKNNATVVTTNTNVTNPKTYDNVYVYVVLGLFGIVILVTSIIYFRKIRKK